MPKNKKEGIIFGLCMCIIMVYLMGLINISIHSGALNMEALITSIKAFPVIFIVAFAIESLFVSKINNKLLSHFVHPDDSKNAHILFNCLFIVTMMSFIMTIVGGILGGDKIMTVLSQFITIWPRNFFVAMFLNLLVAGPLSRFILRKIQERDDNYTLLSNED